jgi:hypothetical protein
MVLSPQKSRFGTNFLNIFQDIKTYIDQTVVYIDFISLSRTPPERSTAMHPSDNILYKYNILIAGDNLIR